MTTIDTTPASRVAAGIALALSVGAALAWGAYTLGYEQGRSYMEEWAVGRGAGIYCPMTGQFRFNGDC